MVAEISASNQSHQSNRINESVIEAKPQGSDANPQEQVEVAQGDEGGKLGGSHWCAACGKWV